MLTPCLSQPSEDVMMIEIAGKANEGDNNARPHKVQTWRRQRVHHFLKSEVLKSHQEVENGDLDGNARRHVAGVFVEKEDLEGNMKHVSLPPPMYVKNISKRR